MKNFKSKMLIFLVFTTCFVNAFALQKGTAKSEMVNEIRTDPNREFSISYELDGGRFESETPTKYKYTEEVRLKNPIKEGYKFYGWTGSNGNSPQKDLILEKRNSGDKSYKANWKSSEDKIEVGDLTLSGKDIEDKYTYTKNKITIKNTVTSDVTVSGTTKKDYIILESGYDGKIILDNVNINTFESGILINKDSYVTVHIKENTTNNLNSAKTGLQQYGSNANLIITADNNTNAILNSSGGAGAGIGSYMDSTAGDLTIRSGNITAKGDLHGAGIGSSYLASYGNIMITGGDITTTGKGVGIGCGNNGRMGKIKITGGKVRSTGLDGVGIGACQNAGINGIEISGGNVTALGSANREGIGWFPSDFGGTGDITISGGYVKTNSTSGTGSIGGSKKLIISGSPIIQSSNYKEEFKNSSGLVLITKRGTVLEDNFTVNNGIIYQNEDLELATLGNSFSKMFIGENVNLSIKNLTINSTEALDTINNGIITIPNNMTLQINEVLTNNGEIINNGLIVGESNIIGEGQIISNKDIKNEEVK